MLLEFPRSRQAASLVGAWVGWGVRGHQSILAILFSLKKAFQFWMNWNLALALPFIDFAPDSWGDTPPDTQRKGFTPGY